MSDKVVGKIFVTSWKNYKKFRDNENNRNLEEFIKVDEKLQILSEQ